MNLYQFTIQVNDGAGLHDEQRLVMAPDERAAAQFAREVADNWRPNAHQDTEHGIYSSPDGWPQWILGHCVPLPYLTVPFAEEQRQARIALVPCTESLADEIGRAADLVRALKDPSLSESSLRSILSDRLGLGGRELAAMLSALEAVQNALAICAERSDEDEPEEIR